MSFATILKQFHDPEETLGSLAVAHQIKYFLIADFVPGTVQGAGGMAAGKQTRGSALLERLLPVDRDNKENRLCV